jgi:Rrf2 family protein
MLSEDRAAGPFSSQFFLSKLWYLEKLQSGGPPPSCRLTKPEAQLYCHPRQGMRMLTRKGKYGLKALLHLARLKAGETAVGGDIASANNLPKKFMDAILVELRNNGLVRSKKGRGGGYALARPAAKISVGEIVRLLDGPLAPIRCASRTAYRPCEDCVSVKQCEVRLAMLEVRDAVAAILDNTSLEEITRHRTSRAKRVVAKV